MKRFTSLLLFATFAVVTSAGAQSKTAPSGGSATDEAVGSISGIKRPTSTPAAATASGPKKGLLANLSKDEKGKELTTVFPASIPKIYLHFTDDSATKGENLKVVWIAESAAGISTKNKSLHEASEVMPGPGTFGTLNLSAPSGGLPVGKYRADLYEGGKLSKTLKFTVTK